MKNAYRLIYFFTPFIALIIIHIMHLTSTPQKLSSLALMNIEALADVEGGTKIYGQELFQSIGTEIVYNHPCEKCNDSWNVCNCSKNYMVQVRKYYCREVNDSDVVCFTGDERIEREILTPCTCFKSGDL